MRHFKGTAMNARVLATIVLSVALLAGCRLAPLQMIENETFVTPAVSSTRALTIDDYQNAIIRAGVTRGWSFAEESPGNLIGTLNVRSKHVVRVRVIFDTAAFSILYVDSSQLSYNADTGEIHPNYNKWVRTLRTQIQKEIALTKAL